MASNNNNPFTITVFEGGAPVVAYVYCDWLAVDGGKEVICVYGGVNPDIAEPFDVEEVEVFEAFYLDTPVTSQSELKKAVDEQLLRDVAASYIPQYS